MMICALQGTPFLYYGQELGLPDAEMALNFSSGPVLLGLRGEAGVPARRPWSSSPPTLGAATAAPTHGISCSDLTRA